MWSHPGLTRRNFVKGTVGWTGAAAIGPAVVRRSANGDAKRGSAQDRIAVGVIGLGRQAVAYNLKSFLQASETQVVAVCDVDRWRLDRGLEAVQAFYGSQKPSGIAKGCAAYRDFREVLVRKDIDAVMISVPDHWHVPMALAAIRAGKDVCCEKPLTRSIEEGRILSDEAARHKRVFRTDSEFRSLPVFHRACELVRNGRIGKIHTIRVGTPFEPDDESTHPAQSEMPVPAELDYEMWLGPAPAAPYTQKRVHPPRAYTRPGWMRVRDYCDGMIANWGAHLIDVAQWGHNTDRTGPVEVEGKGRYPSGGIWNVLLSFEVEYTFADGVRLFYKTDRPYVRFEGSEGWIHAEWQNILRASPESLLQSRIQPHEVHLVLKDEKKDFIDAMKTRGQTLEDAEVGHRTNSMCHLGQIAIELGRKLKWDPRAERFPGDDTANTMIRRALRPPWTL